MSDTSKLLILLGLQDEASPGLKKAGESVRGLSAELMEIGKIAAGFTLGSLGAQLGMSLSEHFKDAITEVENFGNQIYQLQQRIGGNTQTASGLLSVFERFGVSADDADSMLTKFSRNLRGQADASEGGAIALNQFQGTLAELGVSATDSAGNFRPLANVLADVQDKISRLQGDGQTAARAMALFGRSGAQLAPALNLSSEEFRTLQDEAQRLGVTMSQDNVNQVRQLVMAHKDLDEATRGLTIQTGLLITGPLTLLAQKAADVAVTFNEKVIPAIQGAEKEFDTWHKMSGNTAVSTPAGDLSVGDVAKLPNALALGPFGALLFIDKLASHADDAKKALNDARDALGRLASAAGNAIDNAANSDGATPPGVGALGLAKQAITGAASGANAVAQAVADAHAMASGTFDLDLPDDAADRARAKAADAQREANSRASQQNLLDQASIAGKRALEVVQEQINLAQRDNLDLVKASAEAELDLIPIKQRQADLELQLLQTQDKRGQIERETATNRARLTALPASAALEDNQFQQQLLQARLRAGILSGQGIPNGAIGELIAAKRAEAGLEVESLQAGHGVTLAQRAQDAAQLKTDIATAPIRESQADLELQAAIAQRGADQVAAEQRRELLEKTGELVDLQQQQRDLQDKLFEVSQRQQSLSTNTVNVTLNVEGGADGGPNYTKLLQDLSATVMDALKRAAARAEAPAPATAPGASY